MKSERNVIGVDAPFEISEPVNGNTCDRNVLPLPSPDAFRVKSIHGIETPMPEAAK